MASYDRATQAVEDVRRRKVSPIYSCLDCQQWKQALKLCEKKDIKDWDIVLCLKAHALERLGNEKTACRVQYDFVR